MKWILIIVLILVIMLIARAVSEQYKDKYDFYNNLKLFLNQFKINLSYKQDKIIEFLNKTSCKKQFSIFIESYKSYLKNNTLNLDEIKILDDEEKKDLHDIVISIGKHDVKSELSQMESFLQTVDLKLTKAMEDKNKLCPMIIKLSLLFAIGLAILLI